MPIKVGDHLPNAKFRVGTPEGPAWKTTDEIFKGKKVALFAVPGAFTGTCHKMHVPSILQSADGMKGKGVDTIAVTSVNDVFVMDAWRKATGAEKLEFLADGNGDFAKAVDLTFDGSGNGLGTRSRRYSMLVEDGVVKKLNIEEAPGKVEVSGGDTLLQQHRQTVGPTAAERNSRLQRSANSPGQIRAGSRSAFVAVRTDLQDAQAAAH